MVKISEIDAKSMWDNTKQDLPAHQRTLSEIIFSKAGSHKVCWICGDEEDIFLVSSVMDNGKQMQAIFCENCLMIQKNTGLRVVGSEKIE